MVKTFIFYCFSSMAIGLALVGNLHLLLPDQLVHAGDVDAPLYVELRSLERTDTVEHDGELLHARGMFHILTVAIENLSVEHSCEFLDGTIVITDGWDGTVPLAVDAQSILDQRADRDLVGTIPPGGSLVRTLVFDVPLDLTTPHLALEGSAYANAVSDHGRIVLVENLEDF